MTISKRLLVLAGILSFLIALFQAIVTFSPEWSLYFGAPAKLVSNVPLLYVTGLVAAVLFGIFGLYALSGAGYIRHLPLLRGVLLGIGCLYALRGLFLIPIILITAGYLQSSKPVPTTGLVSSLVSLLIGLLYLAGTIGSWERLRPASSSKPNYRTIKEARGG
ncbi:MAG: hypothetical protein AB1473_01430 [Thermodesulfobacteriota bacterium]